MTKEAFLKKLGKNIARLRKEAGMSQTELALRCDKDRQSLNRLENGRANATTFFLFEIAVELKVPVKKLFEFD